MKIKIAVFIDRHDTNLFTLFEDLEEFDDLMQLDPNCILIPIIDGVEFISFDVTDSIDDDNLSSLCRGKAMEHFFYHEVDFHNEYFAFWSFVLKKGRWTPIG